MAKATYNGYRSCTAIDKGGGLQQRICSCFRLVTADLYNRNRRGRHSVPARLLTVDASAAAMFVIVLQLLLTRHSDGLCVFPDFVQSNVTWSNPASGLANWSTAVPSAALSRDWRTRVITTSAGGIQSSARVTVDGGLMRLVMTSPSSTAASKSINVDGSDSSTTFIVRQCVQEVDDNDGLGDRKFLVLYRERTTQASTATDIPSSARIAGRTYQCVQFLKRTESIFQMRTSELTSSRFDLSTSTSPLLDNVIGSLCNSSSLKQIDPWLVVDRNPFTTNANTFGQAAAVTNIHTSLTRPSVVNDRLSTSWSSASTRSPSSSRCPYILDGGFSVRLYHPAQVKTASPRPANCGKSQLPTAVRLEQRCFIAQRPDNDEIQLNFKVESGTDDESDPTCSDMYGIPVEMRPSAANVSSNKSTRRLVRLTCIAEWSSEVGSQSWYAVLLGRHSRHNTHGGGATTTTTTSLSIWTLRLPSRMRRLEDSFTAHLFAGAFAPTMSATSAAATHTGSGPVVYRLDTVRDPTQSDRALCLDDDLDVDECLSGTATSCSDISRAVHCARTCGLCNATRPAQCTIDSSMEGIWRDVTWPDDVTLHVNRTTIGISVGRRRVLDLRCVTWSAPSVTATRLSKAFSGSTTVASNTNEVMLVAGREGGCRPRFVCMRFQFRSKSIVYIRYSRVQSWPFADINSLADPIDCRMFHFDPLPSSSTSWHTPMFQTVDSGDTDPLVGVLDSTRHWRVMYSARELTSVPCRLPEFAFVRAGSGKRSALTDFAVQFADGTLCGSGMVDEIRTGVLRISASNCSSVHKTLLLYPDFMTSRAYDCLLSTILLPSDNRSSANTSGSGQTDHLLWTRVQPLHQMSVDVPSIIHCWLFRSADHSIQIFDAPACPTELFLHQRRRPPNEDHFPKLRMLTSSASPIATFLRPSALSTPSPSSTVDGSLSSLNRRRTGNGEPTDDSANGVAKSRSAAPDTDAFDSEVTTADDPSLDEEQASGGDLILAVTLLAFIACAYVPCLYRGT